MSKLRTEDTKRLRECLNALSEACGHDVFRIEMVDTGKGWRLIITCSKENSELSIAKLIAAELSAKSPGAQLNLGEAVTEPVPTK
ncbi:MAG TPA: hypothetical protein VJN18_32325 [Polyangiaceae bacterium]|nr:hypothetical protein [Polyangiaceae bacterium]